MTFRLPCLLCAVLAASSQLCLAQTTPAVATPAASPGNPAMKRPALQPQSAAAAKGAFHTVAADLPAVKSALDAKDLAGAAKLVGKSGAFVGTVTKTYSPRSNAMVVLDFAPNYGDALTAVVKASNYTRFPNLDDLEGKRILVTGTFVMYRGKAQIELNDPAQIKIIASTKTPGVPKE